MAAPGYQIGALDFGYLNRESVEVAWQGIPWRQQPSTSHMLAAPWQVAWSTFAAEGASTGAPLLTVLFTDGAPDDMQALGDALAVQPAAFLVVALFGSGGQATATSYGYWTTLANANPRVRVISFAGEVSGAAAAASLGRITLA